jgi:hypothetical protein
MNIKNSLFFINKTFDLKKVGDCFDNEETQYKTYALKAFEDYIDCKNEKCITCKFVNVPSSFITHPIDNTNGVVRTCNLQLSNLKVEYNVGNDNKLQFTFSKNVSENIHYKLFKDTQLIHEGDTTSSTTVIKINGIFSDFTNHNYSLYVDYVYCLKNDTFLKTKTCATSINSNLTYSNDINNNNKYQGVLTNSIVGQPTINGVVNYNYLLSNIFNQTTNTNGTQLTF